MPKYRTQNQFMKILDSIYNGSWTQAAEETVKYAFYANDFEKAVEEYFEEFGLEDMEQKITMLTDLMFTIEAATKLRS